MKKILTVTWALTHDAVLAIGASDQKTLIWVFLKGGDKLGNFVIKGRSNSCNKVGRIERGEGGSVGIVITSDKHAVVFNYQVFTLPAHTSISWTPQKSDTHCGPTLLTRVNRAMICAWCSCLVIGEDLHPPPLRSTCLSCLPELIYLGDKQVDEGRSGPQTELHCQTWQTE